MAVKHNLVTETHPNMVYNYKYAFKAKHGEWLLSDLFIYACIEEVGMCESVEEQDRLVLEMMINIAKHYC